MCSGLKILEADFDEALFECGLIDFQLIEPARADRAGDEGAIFLEGGVVAGAFEGAIGGGVDEAA